MGNSRIKILKKLKEAVQFNPIEEKVTSHDGTEELSDKWTTEKKISEFKRNWSEVLFGEIYETNKSNLYNIILNYLKNEKIDTLLYSKQASAGYKMNKAFSNEDTIKLIDYSLPVEKIKPILFEVQGGIVFNCKAIAETGSIILVPTMEEPRLLSLIPPTFIVTLHTKDIYQNFSEAIDTEKWSESRPTNIVLLSGPSKTADIEAILTIGVQGPGKVVVFLIND